MTTQPNSLETAIQQLARENISLKNDIIGLRAVLVEQAAALQNHQNDLQTLIGWAKEQIADQQEAANEADKPVSKKAGA